MWLQTGSAVRNESGLETESAANWVAAGIPQCRGQVAAAVQPVSVRFLEWQQEARPFLQQAIVAGCDAYNANTGAAKANEKQTSRNAEIRRRCRDVLTKEDPS